MIKFHKITSPPKSVPKGEEHVWFASYGAIYVADNNGFPKLITSGSQRGKSIPTGKPEEASILYYCESNGQTYISTPEKWKELPMKSIPGTGGAPGTASTVLVEDVANWFTSINVEGALAEIANAMPHLFGKKILRDYGLDANKALESGDVYVTPSAKSKIGAGWRTTRKSSDGNSFSFQISNDGAAYAGKDGNLARLANQEDLTRLSSSLGGTVGALGSSRIEVGKGLSTNGKTISEGQTIYLDSSALETKPHSHYEYVKKTGDTMSGSLTVKETSTIDSKIFVQSRDNNYRTSLYYNSETDNSGIYDATNGTGILRYNSVTGRTALYAYDRKPTHAASGKFEIYSDGEMILHPTERRKSDSGGLQVLGGASTRVIRAKNSHGGITLGSTQSTNFIDSTGTDASSTKDLVIGGADRATMEFLRVRAKEAYFETRDLISHNALTVGKDMGTDTGTGSFTSKIYLFPYEVSDEKGKNNYTHFGYSQKTQTLHFRSYSRYDQKVSKPGDNTIRNGSKVVVTRPVDYTGTHLAVGGEYTVTELRGNRAVISRGSTTIAAIHISNIRLANPTSSTTETTTSNPLTVKATKFVNTSSIKYKDVTGKFEDGALEKVKETEVYKYKFKRDASQKESVGLIIERGAPKEIVDAEGDSIDGYAMTSYLWKAVQELAGEVDRLKKELKHNTLL